MVKDESRPRRPTGLSKSKITAFEQCPKRLWLQVHRPDEALADPSREARFAAGDEVGAIARSLCPGGTMVEAIPDFATAIKLTKELLVDGSSTPIFEATFEREGVLVRVDILEPGSTAWRMAEVKSSTGVKDYHVSDVATQVWTIEASGIELEDACVRHINREFVLQRDGDYNGLFVDASVREEIEPLIANRSEVVAAAREVLQGPEPELEMGDHCTNPFDCEFQHYCKRGRNEPAWPIALLPNTGRKLAQKWSLEGIIELADLPPGSLTSPLHARIHQATLTGEVFHDGDAAVAATGSWPYPRTWLDFETIAFPVPRWIGTRPWEQVPFQFSAHVEREDGTITHHEFLSIDGTDPREACAAALLLAVPSTGAVIAYHASFERSCIERLAAAAPKYAADLRAISSRLVDLLPVVRACWYHRDQRGSWSIKAVLPTLGGEFSYGGLDIADGLSAQLAYLEATHSKTTAEKREEIDGALRAYCRRDTEAMIEVLRRLVVNCTPIPSA